MGENIKGAQLHFTMHVIRKVEVTKICGTFRILNETSVIETFIKAIYNQFDDLRRKK